MRFTIPVFLLLLFVLAGCGTPLINETRAIGARQECYARDSIQVPVDSTRPFTYRIKCYHLSPRSPFFMSDGRLFDRWDLVKERSVEKTIPAKSKTSALSPDWEYFPAEMKTADGCLPVYIINNPLYWNKNAIPTPPSEEAVLIQLDRVCQNITFYRYNPVQQKLLLLDTVPREKTWTTWWGWPTRIVTYPFAALGDGCLNLALCIVLPIALLTK